MALETGTFISDLVVTNPTGSDALAFADDHIRLIKSTVKNTFPNISGAVTKTHTEINTAVDQAGTAVQPSAMATAIATAVADAKAALYPVGSIYINATNNTNPSTLLGFGTWVAFGAGRVPVGFDGSDSLFNAAEKTGGSKDSSVVSHTHTASVSDPGHNHIVYDVMTVDPNTTAGFPPVGNDDTPYKTRTTSTSTTGISVSIGTTGSSGTNANVQPYITVYMWKRTA